MTNNSKEPIVELEADWGGQLLAVCPVRFLYSGVDEDMLWEVCRQVCLIEWDCNNGEDASLFN